METPSKRSHSVSNHRSKSRSNKPKGLTIQEVANQEYYGSTYIGNGSLTPRSREACLRTV